MSLHSYSSIFNLSHRAVMELLKRPVHIEEKVDGSQFSFGVFGGELKVRSKGSVIEPLAPPGLFSKAVQYVQSVQDKLKEGWTYRGEVLAKPKHNVLAYTRAPNNGIAIWDIDTGEQNYLQPLEKAAESANIGLECVPHLHTGMVSLEHLRTFLQRESFLGGQKIEGVVIKPADYNMFGTDKKTLFAKLVSEEFKEVHGATWKQERGEKHGRDIIQSLGAQFATPARWAKARIHLIEAGQLEGTPRDIGKLISEIPSDVEKECAEEIKAQLYAWAWPQLQRSLVRGVAEWYKDQLLKEAYEEPAKSDVEA